MTTADRTLTSSDPQPPVGTLVRDDCGREWENSGVYPCAWELAGGGDPESWVKVAGNYGPVTVIEWGDGDRCSECGKLMRPGYRYSNCCFAPTVDGESGEVCDIHDVPMAGGVCSSCLADSAHGGR